MKNSKIIAVGILLVISLCPAGAQELDPIANSLGTIDTTREVTLSGTIKYIQLVGERSRIQLLVKNELGEVQEWSLEGPGVGAYTRLDKTDVAFQEHDKITVVIRPLYDDPTAGEIVAMAAAE